VFAVHAHLVFVTKSRHKVFSARHLTRMEEIMPVVCTDFECDLGQFNRENNHVHLLVNFPPKIALARRITSLKGVSPRRMRQEFPDLVPHYYRANKLWSGSYFAGSVGGAPLSIVRPYIEQHNRPFQGTARALAALPARAFTPALKGGALARIRVATARRPRRRCRPKVGAETGVTPIGKWRILVWWRPRTT
jgi:putative transposase